jgi:hypothetical protein
VKVKLILAALTEATSPWWRPIKYSLFPPLGLATLAAYLDDWRAYRDFYRWGSIARGAATHGSAVAGLRHFAYAAGWKKFEPLWDVVIRAKRAGMMLPVLETILSEFGRRSGSRAPRYFGNRAAQLTTTRIGDEPA